MRKNSRTRYEPITYGGDEATRARIFWKRPCQRWTRKRSMRKILERSDKLVATTTDDDEENRWKEFFQHVYIRDRREYYSRFFSIVKK